MFVNSPLSSFIQLNIDAVWYADDNRPLAGYRMALKDVRSKTKDRKVEAN